MWTLQNQQKHVLLSRYYFRHIMAAYLHTKLHNDDSGISCGILYIRIVHLYVSLLVMNFHIGILNSKYVCDNNMIVPCSARVSVAVMLLYTHILQLLGSNLFPHTSYSD